MDSNRPPYSPRLQEPPTPSSSVLPRVLITAGPTHEPIDRVRFLGNRSSGRMGIALAEACLARNWPVTLLLGPIGSSFGESQLSTHISVIQFQTAAELERLLVEHWPAHDVLLMAAAVADYRAKDMTSGKIKRSGDRLTLDLVATPDLLAALAPITRRGQTTVGFALEAAADLDREAVRKLRAKRLDAIVANALETMDSPNITAKIISADGTRACAPHDMPKRDFAEWLLDRLQPGILDRMSAAAHASDQR